MRSIKFILVVFLCSTVSIFYQDSVVNVAEAKPHKSRSNTKSKKRAPRNTNPGDVWERIRAGIRIPVPNPASGLADITIANQANLLGGTTTRIRIVKTAPTQTDATSRLQTVIAAKSLQEKENYPAGQQRVRQTLTPSKSHLVAETDPQAKYTKLGRSLFAPKKPSAEKNSSLTNKSTLSEKEKLDIDKSNSMFKSSVGRIRTRLGLKPGPESQESGNHGQSSSSQPASTITGVSTQTNTPIKSCTDLRKQDIIDLAKQGILTTRYNQMADQCRTKQALINDRISRQVAMYSRGFLNDVAERARPYLYHVVDTLSKHGLPLDLALLPIMESAYKSTALSSANASGIWQFIPSTGRDFGLEQNAFYDARRDVTASTQAAARFLSSLRDHYRGDWLLALAAYNWGPGNVDAAIARNQAEGLDTDYWSLTMPTETQNYVPRLLALARIFANPGGFGLKLRPLRNEPYFIKVRIDREADIRLIAEKEFTTVAKLADYNQEEFGTLNAAYLNATLSGTKTFSLLMPIGNANSLHKSLAFIAQSSKLDKKQLPFYLEPVFANNANRQAIKAPLFSIGLDDKMMTRSGANLLEQARSSLSMPDFPEPNPEKEYLVAHYLEHGETLKSVAEYHGLSEEALRAINKFNRKQIVSLGQRLLIPFKQSSPLSNISRSMFIR